ncbi:MAG TPA: uberolysin/carnocyclin family circular bacteriocin [Candidatus Nesterenkonia stercoripullorum]|uniref:Uberolysin/carnocyclin family circular bacteriocin n=1 Tax=Candidatus Nesterenkonia stercoripullorum TaxID=2838701 RepID=A0A9D1S2N7_9MICC|nr:uberolysin/carnocyclin family circular bacteriocin [Candidatus Nesterenkonia stercoripullorum]
MAQNAKNSLTVTTAVSVSVVGLVLGSFAIAWVAGSLGISSAAATQIVNAVQVGGVALALVGAAFGFGVGSALVATIRWYILRKGKRVAVA